MGSPLVSQDGMALFGHGRDSQSVVNPKEKLLAVGGKPVLGLNVVRPRTIITTTTKAPTTTSEPTTTAWPTEEFSTALPYPTCPPGTFSKTDEYGYPVLDPEGILDCYPEGESKWLLHKRKVQIEYCAKWMNCTVALPFKILFRFFIEQKQIQETK